jgi:hypothetical protein
LKGSGAMLRGTTNASSGKTEAKGKMRVITISAINRQVTIKQYIQGIRSAITNPNAEFKHGLTTWWPTKGNDIRAQFLRGIHDRINQGIPYMERKSS